MTKDPIDESKKLVSEFNEAKFQLIRLHNSWCSCSVHRRNGNLTSWRWELDIIWDELSSKAKKTKVNKWPEEIKDIDDKINAAVLLKKPTEIYLELRTKHRKLKFIQDDVGMGGKMRDYDDDGIDE